MEAVSDLLPAETLEVGGELSWLGVTRPFLTRRCLAQCSA
jgi:hypothetical protein